MVVWKRPKINEVEAGIDHYLKILAPFGGAVSVGKMLDCIVHCISKIYLQNAAAYWLAVEDWETRSNCLEGMRLTRWVDVDGDKCVADNSTEISNKSPNDELS